MDYDKVIEPFDVFFLWLTPAFVENNFVERSNSSDDITCVKLIFHFVLIIHDCKIAFSKCIRSDID